MRIKNYSLVRSQPSFVNNLAWNFLDTTSTVRARPAMLQLAALGTLVVVARKRRLADVPERHAHSIFAGRTRAKNPAPE